MKSGNQIDPKKETHKHLIEAVIAYAAFCSLSALSRFALPVFLLVVVGGFAFPLIWAKLTRNWASIGFTRQNLGRALLWGLGTGLAVMLYIFVTSGGERSLPPMLGVQLAVGIPMWFIIVSPFQEFFFRGWLQPKFQQALGKWAALVVTSICFTLWHFFPPFDLPNPTGTLPLTSLTGILTTFGLGMIWGYVLQRTGNIVAPWVTHSLAGIAIVLTGTMSFIQYTP
jgi:membrane protease YdiL (CAAX protease family)